jgi:late competence protein required for DNA uptake (superfamily II DNA/RNA helicase)
MNNFQIKALPYHQFAHLFSASETQLKNVGAVKMTVDEFPGFPCRVSLQDATIGEEVILLPFQHHKTNSPYKATGPIFVRKNINEATLAINEIPTMLLHRLLSLRCYNKEGIMINATVIEGKIVSETLQTLFTNKEIAYVHIHNAKPGCYNCVVERV